ncbi:MAG TPA: isocitrate lyase/phosphoenolpyruvate mutase family protein [Verrucomicrobiae bacterium]|jgi:2-methylisocitrate lyase-like PEP mutase family enzyme
MPNLAEKFHALHDSDDILVLPNAWDVGSAKVIEDAGAKAIATSSAGVAWALGFPDGNILPPKILAELTSRITDVLKIPLTIDFEGGYTNNPSKIGDTLAPVIDAGAVGINIEDGEGAPDLLAKKIEKARKAAEKAGVNVFINARTDVFLAEIGSPKSRVAETIKRSECYEAAGANGLFVPGLSDADEIRAIASGIKIPLNVMTVPGLPKARELEKLGVRRLTSGQTIPQVVWKTVALLAKKFLETGDAKVVTTDTMPYSNLQDLFKR